MTRATASSVVVAAILAATVLGDQLAQTIDEPAERRDGGFAPGERREPPILDPAPPAPVSR